MNHFELGIRQSFHFYLSAFSQPDKLSCVPSPTRLRIAPGLRSAPDVLPVDEKSEISEANLALFGNVSGFHFYTPASVAYD